MIVPFGPGYIRPEVDRGRAGTRQDDRAEPGESLLDVVVSQLAGQGTPAHQIWLPPLGLPPTLDQLLPPLSISPQFGCAVENPEWRGKLRAVTGIVDRPFEQRRDPLWVDLSGGRGPRGGRGRARAPASPRCCGP